VANQAEADFQQRFRGRLVRPGDPDYDTARALYNGMIDKRPRLIAQCVDVADVMAAVNYGREQQLLIAIRGGGHNGPGLGSCNDGLVIDLSERYGSDRAARPVMSTTPPIPSAWRCRSASSRAPASPV
jgi:FAD/FMN-containing dehydrogenase